MFLPLGFEQQSVLTSLGRMVYYTASGAPWHQPNEDDNREKLVFLHGFGGGSSAYEWSKVYPAFAAEYQVIAPDLIGWGRSEHPIRNYTIDDYLTTITEFLEQTCDRPVSVIASSLTAAFTMRIAIARPELFKSLILTTPAGLSDFGENYSRSFFAQLVSTPILDRLLYSAGIATSNGIRSFLEQRQFASANRIYQEIVEAYLESAQQPNAEYAALSFVRGDLCFDLSLYVPQLNVPTAIIWGQKSQFTGPEIGRRFAAMNPQAIRVFQPLDNVGLTPQLELPAVTIGLIRRFLTVLTQETEPRELEAKS
jgi:pimeloyl-ACP methyl ester carboxylesterase